MQKVMARTLRVLVGAVVLAAFASSGAAAAQSSGKAGDFDYYALVLSWSPSYCAGAGSSRDEPQCDGSRPYAFVLHGLWPQYERGYPQACRTRDKPWVAKKTIDRMLDIMPSPRLVIHEYKAHGTCSGLAPDDYFGLARRLYGKIAIPQQFRAPTQAIETSPDEIEQAFLAANPKLKPDMLAVDCGKPGRLREIRFCFSIAGEPRSCGENEDQNRLCRSKRVSMPPVRGRSFNSGKPAGSGDAKPALDDTVDNPI